MNGQGYEWLQYFRSFYDLTRAKWAGPSGYRRNLDDAPGYKLSLYCGAHSQGHNTPDKPNSFAARVTCCDDSAKPQGTNPIFVTSIHTTHTPRSLSQPPSLQRQHTLANHQISITALIPQQWPSQRTRLSTTRPTRVNSRSRFRCNLCGWNYGRSGESETDGIFYDKIQPIGTASKSLRPTDTPRSRVLTPNSEGTIGAFNFYISSSYSSPSGTFTDD